MKSLFTFKVVPGAVTYNVVTIIRNQHTNGIERLSSSPRSVPKDKKKALGSINFVRQLDENRFVVVDYAGAEVELHKVRNSFHLFDTVVNILFRDG